MTRVPIRALPAIALSTLLMAGGCSGDETRAQQADGATIPSDPEVVSARADRSRALGDSAAPLVVHEISDFECPYCQQFYHQTWPVLDSLYVERGLLQYVWHDYPNPNHPRAWPAGEAAFCAGAAGRFWPMHDRLFEEQEKWSSAADPMEIFAGYASDLGIDEASFRRCMNQDLAAPFMIRDYGSAARAGIRGTPFFSIQSRQGGSLSIQGAQPPEQFRAVLDSLLREQDVTPPGS